MNEYSFGTLGVVPIFVNAGSAILPAIAAPILSALALLLKPRELLHACREKPATAITVVTVVLLLGGGFAWLYMGHTPPAANARAAPAEISPAEYWTKFALDVIRAEESGGFNSATQPAASVRRDGPAVFRWNNARTGHDGSPSPLDVGPKPLWDFSEEGAMFLSSPLVIGGRVYAAGAVPSTTSNIGVLYCRDALSGKEIWTLDSVNGKSIKAFFSSPAVTADGKYLLIGQGLHADNACALICVETDTGKVHWAVSTSLHIESSPAIFGDIAVVGAGAIEDDNHKPTTDPGYVIAVRISDGKQLWKHPVNDPESSPAISKDGIVYIGAGFQGNAVVALRTESDEQLASKGLKRELWNTKVRLPITGPVTLIDDLVIVGGGNSDFVTTAPHPAGVIIALDARTGNVKWEKALPDSVLGGIAARDGKLIAAVRNGEMISLNQADGNILWRVMLKNAEIVASPAFTGSHIYVTTKIGHLVVLDAKDGREIERVFLHGNKPAPEKLTLSSPLIVGSRIFVGSETGLHCLVGRKAAP